MDFKVKGISWVGNVYQKFEAMCLEVEDVVCQETAKYVEAQVQTVGSSVKKFYAEVLEDLLPPSSFDSKKPEGSGLFLEDTAFGTYEKPKLTGEEDPATDDSSTHDTSEISMPAVKSLCRGKNDEVDICKRSKPGVGKYPINKRLFPVEVSDVITTSGKNSGQVSLRSRVHNKNHLHPSVSVNPIIAADLISPLERNDKDEMCTKSRIPIETGHLKANLPPPDVLQLVAPVGKGISQTSSFSSPLKVDHAKAYDTQTEMTSPTSFDLPICDSCKTTGTSCSYRVVKIGCAADSSSAFQSPLVHPVVCESKVIENRLSTFNDISTESNVDTSVTSYTLPLKGSSWTEPEQLSEEQSDDDHLGLDEGEEIIELAPETIDEFQNAKLEESCIVVDSDELPLVPHQAGKHRSYKKKIRDALASRMRLAKKQEYEQLVVWHKDTNRPPVGNSSPPLLIKDLNKSTSHEIGESEWELL